jgi:CBS-domain-containing membrane protein
MGKSARIHNFDALKDARAALATFAQEVGASLASVDADIQRVSQWLSVDRTTHWKLELRRRQEAMQRIKAEIMRKRIVASPDPASVSLEERRLDRARERLEEARRKIEKVQRWVPVWQREAMLYKSSTRSLSDALHGDIPRALAVLAGMMQTLDEYTGLAPEPAEQQPHPTPPVRRDTEDGS